MASSIPKLPGLVSANGNRAWVYAGAHAVDLHTSYDITRAFRIFGLVNNVFDEGYGVIGTFFNLEAGNSGTSADAQLGGDLFTNPRTITPRPPIVAYRGLKVKLW